MPAPSAQYNADRTGSLGGELGPTGCCHGQAGDLPDHGTQAAMAKPFFAAGEDRLLVAALDINDPVCFQPSLGESRSEKIGPGEAPQHLPACACGDACREKCRRRTIHGAIPAPGDLVERCEGEPAARDIRPATPSSSAAVCRLFNHPLAKETLAERGNWASSKSRMRTRAGKAAASPTNNASCCARAGSARTIFDHRVGCQG